MDVHHVGEQYTQILEKQKQTLQKAKQRQGQRPRDRAPRDEAYMGFMMTVMLSGNRPQNHVVHSSFMPPAYHPCVTPVAELKRIAIRDLQLETHHRGTYVWLRSLTPPNRMTAIMALMEDENGDAVLLQLYQQEDEEVRKATDIVNVGTILLVKEPYFKVMGDGRYGLRVDHVSDIVRVENDEKIPKAWRTGYRNGASAESWKTEGNQAMGEGRHWDAIRDYSHALSQPATENENAIIQRNRALAHLKTGHFDAALSDTGFPKFDSSLPEKALFRAAEALYHLGRFRESVDVLKLLHTTYPESKQAAVALGRARRRMQEQESGVYNFKQLQERAQKLRPPHLDHATYIGPVEIRQTDSKGRGLFTTAAVKAGDLLLCEKAFSHAFADENGSRTSVLMNLETNQGFMGAQADLIKLTVQKLRRNPSVAPVFTTLFHGTYKGVDARFVDSQPIVDTFLVDRVMSFNVFGCPVSSLSTHKKFLAKVEQEEKHHSCGIWTQASYINHSCNSTAWRGFIGDVMVVRASRDLEPGSEITFWYHNPTGDAAELETKLKHWEFVCDCCICRDRRNTAAAVFRERRKLVEHLKKMFDSCARGAIQPDKLERLLDGLNKTYAQPAETVPRLQVWDPQLALARMYAARNKMTKCVESIGKTLAALGFTVVGADASTTRFAVVKWGLMLEHLVGTFLLAQNAFVDLGRWDDSQQAEEYARTAYRIVVGDDTSFEATYRS